jgi:hypothetical protein
MTRYSKWSLSFVFYYQNPVCISLSSSVHATCNAVILRHCNAWLIFSEQYKSLTFQCKCT